VTINGTDQPTITRIGGGLLAGLNVAGSIYVEGRYQWVDSHGLDTSLPGLFGYVGYRF
jgi:hypothetical protein